MYLEAEDRLCWTSIFPVHTSQQYPQYYSLNCPVECLLSKPLWQTSLCSQWLSWYTYIELSHFGLHAIFSNSRIHDSLPHLVQVHTKLISISSLLYFTQGNSILPIITLEKKQNIEYNVSALLWQAQEQKINQFAMKTIHKQVFWSFIYT